MVVSGTTSDSVTALSNANINQSLNSLSQD
jgi:hypothetical protein